MKFALAFFLLASTTAYAEAPPQCGDHAQAVTALTKTYGEILQATGQAQGGVMELWGNPRTHTWTLMAVNPDGIACIISVGDHLAATLGEPT